MVTWDSLKGSIVQNPPDPLPPKKTLVNHTATQPPILLTVTGDQSTYQKCAANNTD